jgi:outer membrane protein
MKNLSVIFSSLALIGVLVLFGMQMSGNKKGIGSAGHSSAETGMAGHSRIAYVDIDTLEANYTYLKNKKEEFTKRQSSMKAELQNSAEQMQRDYANVQRKAQAGTLTQAEYQSAEKRLGQMQQSLQTREAALTEQLLKEQDEFNRELQTRLDKFLEEYNTDNRYDYILSYSKSGSILYADKSLNITNEVIEGMNKLPDNTSDTTKKKK